MCLALPARVISVAPIHETAIVALEGVKKEISTALVEDVAVDDFVLVHVGFALNKVSEEEAKKTLALMAEAGITSSGTGESSV